MLFDKYLRLYAKESRALKRQRRDYELNEKVEMATFKQKWAEILVDEQESSDDLRPMLGLDSYDPAPKPYKIFSRSNVAKTLAKNQLSMNLMYDREI